MSSRTGGVETPLTMLTDLVMQVEIIIALGVGLLTGGLFCLSLWISVNRFERHPSARVLLGGAMLRFTVTLSVFGLLAGFAGWPHLLVALIGFVGMRSIILHRLSARTFQHQPGLRR